MSIDQSPVVTPLEDVFRESVIDYIKAIAFSNTLHYLSLDAIKQGLETGQIDPATAYTHLDNIRPPEHEQ